MEEVRSPIYNEAIPWKEDQKEVVLLYFQQHIADKRPPHKIE